MARNRHLPRQTASPSARAPVMLTACDGHYVADARTIALPLVGGGHQDWNYLLGTLGLLGAARFLGTLTCGLGVLLVLAAVQILAVDLVAAWNRAGTDGYG
jgi:hypothetical protein